MNFISAHLWMLGSGLGLGGLGVLASVFPQISLPILTAIGEWFARRSLSEIALFIVAGLLVWQHLGLLDAHRQTKAAVQSLVACTKARATDQANFAAAQRRAAAQNSAQVTAKEAEWKGEATDEAQSYRSDLAALRAAYKRLRDSADAASASNAGQGDASPPSADRPGPNADGVQVHSPADVSSSRDEDAAEIELRLMHLQDLIATLEHSDPNEAPK